MKAFIYDMDGVIVDTEPVHIKVEQDLVRKYGGEPKLEDFLACQGLGIKAAMKKLIACYDLKGITAEQLCKEKDEVFLKEVIEEGVIPIDGILDLIDATAKKTGWKTAIASSSPDQFIGIVVDQLGIREKFDYLMSGERFKESKPNPEIYLKTAEALGVAPKDCIVLEDSSNGAIAAKRAGMYCIGFRSPHSGQQDFSMVDEIVQRIDEINLEKF